MHRVGMLAIVVIVLQIFAENSSALGIHDKAENGDLAGVQSLLASDPGSINAADNQGKTALHIAAQKGHLAVVSCLLDAGSDIEQWDDRTNTPLLSAIAGNQFEVVKLLVERGADIRVEHGSYGLALDYAFWQECIQGKSGMTQLLIAQGLNFDPNAQFFGVTRMNLATTFGNSDMAEYLIELGAHAGAISNDRGETELAFAVRCGYPDIAQLLVWHGADVNVPDREGNFPIQMAVERGSLILVRLLADHGAAIDITDHYFDRNLLHLAAIKGHYDVVAHLIDLDVDLNAADNTGKTPLYYAAKYGHRRTAELMSRHGAVAGDDVVENYGRPRDLTRDLYRGKAVIRRLIRRGDAIRTRNHLVIIDAEEFNVIRPTEPSLTNGCIVPDELRGQNVIVLYSTYHGRPENPAYIHQIEDSLDQVLYIQSKLDHWRGCKNSVYVSPRENNTYDGFELYSIQITKRNPALAHLFTVDGLTVYYPGWPPENFKKYKDDIAYLKHYTDQVDIAFLAITNPGEPNAGARYFIEEMRPKLIIPIDAARRVHLFSDFAKKVREWGFDTRVECMENAGDRVMYNGGR